MRFCARQGRWILVASLVVGLASPALARMVAPYVDILIALLLFTACLRIGPNAFSATAGKIGASLAIVLVLQILLPILMLLFVRAVALDAPLAVALILLASAPSLSGNPHLVVLMGFNPSNALRLLVTGTVLLPLTIIPVFLLVPELGALDDVVDASMLLLAVILIAAGIAFLIRLTLLKQPSGAAIEQIDGVSTVLLAIVVVGLMAAIGEELAVDRQNVVTTLAVATAANFGLQIFAALFLAGGRMGAYVVPVGIIAGNRNIALFLTALPVATTQPVLLFIACYQIPMYLTPVIMRPFYQALMRRLSSNG